jgi:hypothetical protein
MSEPWTLAVHQAGHCVTAHILGLRVARVKTSENGFCDVSWYRRTNAGSPTRAVVEADALVALAGAAAQWLYRDGTVRSVHVRRDDAMAVVVLRQVEPDDAVEEKWREYLRQRALHLVSEPLHQLLIARLAGFLVERQHAEGREVHAFLDREQSSVRALLANSATTLEERIGLAGHRLFAIPLERLALGPRLTRALRTARIATLGRLLQYSEYDLQAMVSREDVVLIRKAVAARGFELAKYPRSNVREVSFSVESIYERDEAHS